MYDGGHAFDLQVVALYSFATLTHKFPLSDAARGCRPYQLESDSYGLPAASSTRRAYLKSRQGISVRESRKARSMFGTQCSVAARTVIRFTGDHGLS